MRARLGLVKRRGRSVEQVDKLTWGIGCGARSEGEVDRLQRSICWLDQSIATVDLLIRAVSWGGRVAYAADRSRESTC